MAVYRFRVVYEENEDVQRDIEIKSNQTFADFHNAIQEAIKFDNKHAASIFVSDDYWRKNQEVTLLEEDLDKDVKLMSKTKISSLIETPYQRFVYLFDKKVQWCFLIELIKISEEDPKKTYPLCAKTIGTAPKQYKLAKPIEEEKKPSGDPASKILEDVDLDDEDDDLEDDAYKHAKEENHLVDEEDVKQMEGEEGEEEDEEMAMEDDGHEGSDYGDEEHHDDDKY